MLAVSLHRLLEQFHNDSLLNARLPYLLTDFLSSFIMTAFVSFLAANLPATPITSLPARIADPVKMNRRRSSSFSTNARDCDFAAKSAPSKGSTLAWQPIHIAMTANSMV